MEKIKARAERITVLVLSVFSIIISILELTGLLHAMPTEWAHEKVPVFTLLLLGVIASFLAFESRPNCEFIGAVTTAEANRIISSLNGVEVKQVATRAEGYLYVRDRIRKAKKSVCDITWGPPSTQVSGYEKELYEKYWTEIADICSDDREFEYREIMCMSTRGRRSRARSMAERKPPNYILRLIDEASGRVPPLLQFVIIDSEEVIITRYTAPSEHDPVVSIKNNAVVAVFQKHFDYAFTIAKPFYENRAVVDEALFHSL